MIHRIGAIEVLDDLGAGPGSRVLRVRRAADGREYALKVVSGRGRGRKFLAQLRNEARLGPLLDHPALVRVEGFEATSDWLWRPTGGRLLLEYLPGRTLDRLPRLPPPRLVPVLARAAAGLAHMHARGVHHADVKPNNIVLGPAGATVIDFGLARRAGERPGRLQGTPDYMAPEAVATGLVDGRADVFGFGATAYRLLTGRGVPTAAPGLAVSAGVFRSRLGSVAGMCPECPEELADLVHGCLDHDPKGRPAMAAVAAALAALAGRLPPG